VQVICQHRGPAGYKEDPRSPRREIARIHVPRSLAPAAVCMSRTGRRSTFSIDTVEADGSWLPEIFMQYRRLLDYNKLLMHGPYDSIHPVYYYGVTVPTADLAPVYYVSSQGYPAYLSTPT